MIVLMNQTIAYLASKGKRYPMANNQIAEPKGGYVLIKTIELC